MIHLDREMNFQLFMSRFLLHFSLFLVINIPPSLSQIGVYHDCLYPFQCGNIKANYPFWGVYRPSFCGHPDLKLECGDLHTPTIIMKGVKYNVLSIDEKSQTMRISRADFQAGICRFEFTNTTIFSPLFTYSSGYNMIKFLYGCRVPPAQMIAQESCDSGDIYVKEGADGAGECQTSVIFPINGSLISPAMRVSVLEQGLKEGFDVRWNMNGMKCEDCIKSNGSCGYDIDTNQTVCHCFGQQFASITACPSSQAFPGNRNPIAPRTGIVIAAGSVAVIFLVAVFILIIRRYKRRMAARLKDFEPLSKNTNNTATYTTTKSTDLSKSTPCYCLSRSDVGSISTYFGAQVFDSAELEEATNNFDSSKKLGDGGFGTVYYGSLKNGCEVAVKRFYEHNFNHVEQFMNEVEILARLSHTNLVTLYGCTSRRSRELLIVYEYISNGTLGDHLHGRKSKSGLLTWPIRFNIAIETANALAYLHASDVIHRDVKTNNILLNEEFHVKVADFGLSRLFPNDVTHVSTSPQGTAGYVDPEYHQCYKLTDKSDVYSFGVVLIELISSLPAVDISRIRHDINLSNMAITRIQNQKLQELVDPYLGFEKDYSVKNMITSVAELAFRCLQQDREIRPSMQEVLEVLKGIQNNGKAMA